MEVKFLQLPDEIQELAQSNNGLKQALSRLANGTPPTKRSWFYEHKDPSWILDSIVSKLHDMQDLKNISDWDLSKSDKYGPQGESAPLKDRLETFNEYFLHLDAPSIVKDPVWEKAKLEAIRRLKFNESGSPVTSEAVIARGVGEHKYNSSSGYPLWVKRRTEEAKSEALADAPSCIEKRFPCVLGSRASMGKTGVKARHIFMASMAVNVRGQRYQQPLQDYIRSLKLNFFLPWEGWDSVQADISSHWDSSSLKFGADYTKMDQHFNAFHGLEVFDVVKHYFRREFWPELEQIIRYVFTMPIITNLGYVDQPHAMPSGSEWTNFLETVWNYIFVIYLEMKYHLHFVTSMGIGDDQLWLLSGEWNSDKSRQWCIETVVKEFENAGLPGNPEKQEVGLTDTAFLQRFITGDWSGTDAQTKAAGVYSLIRNVTSQTFPEFYHNDDEWDKNMFVLRVLMIAENANQHPLFKWYIQDFVAKANDNILEFIKAGNDKWIETQNRSKRISNFLPTYNQEKANKPLSDFDCVKLLRELT